MPRATKKIRLRTPDLSDMTAAQRQELTHRVVDALDYIFKTFPPEGNNAKHREKVQDGK